MLILVLPKHVFLTDSQMLVVSWRVIYLPFFASENAVYINEQEDVSCKELYSNTLLKRYWLSQHFF